MTDVFVSYKREDAARVARLVQALQKAGFDVWWDQEGLPGGEPWREKIDAALKASRSAIVVWTAASVGSQGGFVRDEAGRAMAAGKLVPVLFDRVGPPLGFGELQAIDLVSWKGSASDPGFQDLVAALRARIEGRPPPSPTAGMRRLARRLTLGSLASALTVAAIAFATDALGLQQRLCRAPLLQPGLSDACGALSLGGRPARAERLAWEQLPAGDCEALRGFRNQFPAGAYSDKAAALIAAPRVTRSERMTPGERSLGRLFVGKNLAPPLPTEAAARAAAQQRGQDDADHACKDFMASGLFVFRRAEVQVERWDCSRGGGGWLCGFDGRTVCHLDEKQIFETARCDFQPAPGTP